SRPRPFVGNLLCATKHVLSALPERSLHPLLAHVKKKIASKINMLLSQAHPLADAAAPSLASARTRRQATDSSRESGGPQRRARAAWAAHAAGASPGATAPAWNARGRGRAVGSLRFFHARRIGMLRSATVLGRSPMPARTLGQKTWKSTSLCVCPWTRETTA